MNEILKILYDIFAGAGMLVVLFVIIAFLYGLVVSRNTKKAQAEQTSDLLKRLNPELRKRYLEEMLKEVDGSIEEVEEKINEQQTKGS
jgi:hypothetical protein